MQKVLHGPHFKTVHNATTDKRATNKWLTDGKLQSETEALVVAIQDGVTKTKAYRNQILKKNVDPTCGLCDGVSQTVWHI